MEYRKLDKVQVKELKLDSEETTQIIIHVNFSNYHPDTVGKVRVDYLHKIQKTIESGIARADMVMESAAKGKI